MKKNLFACIYYPTLVAAALPVLFLCNLARYLAPDAMIAYSVVLLAGALFMAWLRKGEFRLAIAFARSPVAAAAHAAAAFAFCRFVKPSSGVPAEAAACGAVFFMWLAMKLCVRSSALRDRAALAMFWGGGAISLFAAIKILPFPLNYAPLVAMFFWFMFRGPVNRFWPDRKKAGAFLGHVFFFILVLLAVHFFVVVKSRSPHFIALLVILFEALFLLRAHRALMKSFFPVVIFADIALVAAAFAPGIAVYISPLSLLMIVFFEGLVSAACAIIRPASQGRPKTAGSAVVFALCVAVFSIARSQAAPCDYARAGKEFFIHSAEEGSYDMVLSRDGRYLYAVFGAPRNVVEKIDTTGREKKIVYRLNDPKAQPERLFLDERRNRIVVAIWGKSDKKLGVFDADTLKPVGIYGGGGYPKNPDNVKSDSAFRYYYLLGERTGEVAKIDADTMEPVNYGKSTMGVAYGMCMDDKRRLLYTASWIGPHITAFKTGSMKTRHVFNTEIIKAEIACDPKTGRVYSGNFVDDSISVYDMKEGRRRVKKLPAAFGSRDLAMDADSRLLISGAYFSGIVEGLDMDSGERLFSAEPGKYVRGVEYDPKTGRVFVACHCGILEMKKKFRR